MDSNRFRQLYDTARNAANVKGDDVRVRSDARRHLRQALDLLSLEAEANQWAVVEWARKNGFPPFDDVVREKGL
jgi:hypothetical protein